ncbi:MAG TPA: DNA mismatch repair endonuclease MutL [Erysipelothrix sp.]
MSRIKVLNTHLTNMIAAGEVVERPAGIIKELIENALDAQATQIEVTFKEGGMEYLQVSDNGIGMSRDDLKNAFQRHSTSKIFKEDDLLNISTFGFRGEALPSIASVSTVIARSNDGHESNEIILNNGKIESIGPAPRNKGTSIEVMDLFLHVPARLKHIKNIHYEAAIILDIVQKFALGNPEISFTLYNNDKKTFQSLGNGSYDDVYFQIYGSNVSSESFYYERENYDFKINGIYTLPNHNRANRYSIWLYINNRMIRYPKALNTILDAYRRHLPPGRFPMIMMNIETDPSLVDVNVHPSKWEIRLAQEESLVTLINETIADLLIKDMKAPKVSLQSPEQVHFEKELLDIQNKEKMKVVEKNLIKEYQQALKKEKQEEDSTNKEEKRIDDIYKEIQKVNQLKDVEETIEPITVLSQMSGKYILGQGSEGLYIIDQHAAMERIRYEYYQNQLLNKQVPQQDLLVPILIEGRKSLIPQIDSINETLSQFQIVLEEFGEDTLIVRSLPQWVVDDNPQMFVEDILDFYETGLKVREEDVKRDVLATLACHSSVRFNEFLSQQEMEKIVSDLRQCEQPFHCPHGRPTFLRITHKQLIKEFKR